MKHTFAISAYGSSPYLGDCIISLKNQEYGSDVILCTSTPSEYIEEIAERHNVPVFIREGKSSLKDDWNFAAGTAAGERGAELITIAHQDDIYSPGYTRALMEAYGRYPDMLLFCTRYATIDKDGNVTGGRSEAVKRVLRLPLRLRAFSGTGFIKRLSLIFGNSICCPSCTYNIRLTGLPLFRDDDSFVIDWKTLIRLSGMKGRFICEERELISYRVHPGAATRKNIDNHVREKEEREVYGMLWPGPAAALLSRLMQTSYAAYDE